MYILYIIVLKIKLITNLHALSVAIHVPPNNVLISKGTHLHPIYVRMIDFNQCFIRGPTLPAYFSTSRFWVIFSGTSYRY